MYEEKDMQQSAINSAISAVIAGAIYIAIFYITQHHIRSGIVETIICAVATFVIAFAINIFFVRLQANRK